MGMIIMGGKINSWIIVIVSSLFLLASCVSIDKEKPNLDEPVGEGKQETAKPEQKPDLVPVEIKQANVDKIYGWLDDQTILYSYVQEGSYIIASYELFNGSSRIIFTSEHPINNVKIHQSGQMLFVHTSKSSYAATVYFIDPRGNTFYSTEIESHELTYKWNEQDPNLMLVTAFYEDWSYETMYIHVEDRTINKVEGLQPFMKWIGENGILEQEWNREEQEFFAPIIKKSLDNMEAGQRLIEQVYRFDVLGNKLMTINVPTNRPDIMEYHFYDQNLEQYSTIVTPNLTQYTDWLIPFYDYMDSNHVFLSFVPKKHESADSYKEGFQLISFNLQENTKKVIIDQLDNKPISCAPNGKYCLYGHLFEQLLDLDSAKIFNLIIK